jgi:hypothetical protein
MEIQDSRLGIGDGLGIDIGYWALDVAYSTGYLSIGNRPQSSLPLPYPLLFSLIPPSLSLSLSLSPPSIMRLQAATTWQRLSHPSASLQSPNLPLLWISSLASPSSSTPLSCVPIGSLPLSHQLPRISPLVYGGVQRQRHHHRHRHPQPVTRCSTPGFHRRKERKDAASGANANECPGRHATRLVRPGARQSKKGVPSGFGPSNSGPSSIMPVPFPWDVASMHDEPLDISNKRSTPLDLDRLIPTPWKLTCSPSIVVYISAVSQPRAAASPPPHTGAFSATPGLHHITTVRSKAYWSGQERISRL